MKATNFAAELMPTSISRRHATGPQLARSRKSLQYVNPRTSCPCSAAQNNASDTTTRIQPGERGVISRVKMPPSNAAFAIFVGDGCCTAGHARRQGGVPRSECNRFGSERLGYGPLCPQQTFSTLVRLSSAMKRRFIS